MSHVLRRLRSESGLTQSEVARRLSSRGTPVTQGHLSSVENGHRQPSTDLLRALLRFYGATPSDCAEAIGARGAA